LLILDDLSYVRRDQTETSVLFELIAERYERKSLAITANQPFSGPAFPGFGHMSGQTRVPIRELSRSYRLEEGGRLENQWAHEHALF
jgi:IstB-like ATP binding protein